MVILIAGDTHTGKTLLAQKLLEKYRYPYISIDHLKMGLIRSGQSELSADSSDEALTAYLWPIIREMIKTVIENSQHIIIEGCYIPFGWERDFEPKYVEHIKYVCLIFSKAYIEHHLSDILSFEHVIENRMPEKLEVSKLIATNEYNLEQCILHSYKYILIEYDYQVDADCL